MKKLKIVDGFDVRNHIDLDFCSVEDSLTCPYIPKNEIWLDKTFLKEKEAVLATFTKKRKLMKKYGYEKAKEILLNEMRVAAPTKIHLQLLEKRGPIKIFLVNGKLVRQYLDFNFVFGGHWLVYKYVPKNEIWIDNATLTKERKYVLIHEWREVTLMKKGKKYNNAHDFANAEEKEARRTDGVAKYLKD